MHEPDGAHAEYVDAHRRTKAEIQPAMEGVLDSEGEGSAGRELWRRDFKCLQVATTRDGWQLDTYLIRKSGGILRLYRGIGLGRNQRRVASVDLAARTICTHDRRITCHRHGAATVTLASWVTRQKACGGRQRGPEDHNRQHQHRAFSVPIHGVRVSTLNC